MGSARPPINRIRLDVSLQPQSGEIRATAELTLPATAQGTPLVLELQRPLEVDTIESLSGATATLERLAEPEPQPGTEPDGGADAKEPDGTDDDTSKAADTAHAVNRYRVDLTPEPAAGDSVMLRIAYHGVLREDWQAGERPGEIHNFEVRSHIGPEGIYLSGDAPWYPRPPLEDAPSDSSAPIAPDAPDRLTDFTVQLEGVPEMLLVASGNRVLVQDADAVRRPGAPSRWRTPFPLPALSVAGGPHHAVQRRVGVVTLWADVSPANQQFAERMLEAAAGYLELYQPLIGPYPFREMVIVENFFSSGFAFPGFTLLSSAVVAMGESSLRPGYLDHELLHAWWGNGVLGTADEGIWSEALTSYCANLMRPTLEGRPEESRAQRRSILEGLSRTDAAQLKPLDTFGLNDGASRFVGYQKGSLVFDQVARTIGQETFWYALRTLLATRLGEPTTWADLETTFERASGKDLTALFALYVHGTELPDLTPSAARWDPADRRLHITLREPSVLDVPALRVRLEALDATPLDQVETAVRSEDRELVLPLDAKPPAVVVDPDFEVLRRLPPASWMPSISGLLGPRPITLLRAKAGTEPDGLEQAYGVVADDVRGRWKDGKGATEVRVRRPRRSAPPLPSGHVLALGNAVDVSWVRDLLERAQLRIDTTQRSFTLEGSVYAQPTQAVLACVRRPDEAGAQLCAVWGNSPAALERAYLLTFYGGDSLLVFDHGQAVLRRRFDRVAPVPVS